MARLGRYVAIGDQAVSSISNFAAVAVVAHVATVDQFGQFSLAYAGLLLFLGSQRAFIGETLLVKHSGTGTLAVASRKGAMGASLLVGAMGVPLFLAGGAVAEEPSRLLWFVIAGSLPLVLLQDVLRYLFICEGRAWAALLVDAVWAVVALGSMVVVVSSSRTVWAVVFCWGAGAAAALALGLVFCRVMPAPRSGWSWLRANRQPGLRYLGEFSALNASALAVLYFLALPLGAAGVGALRAAQLLFSPLNTAFSAIRMAVIPELVRTRGTPVFRKRIIETSAVVAGLAGAWGAAVMLLPSSVGTLVLGTTWESAAELRLPYLAQYLAMVPYTVLLAYYRSVQADKQSTLMRATLAALTLVPPFSLAYASGTVAAAWAFTLAVSVATVTGAVATGVSVSRSRTGSGRQPETVEAERRSAADAR